MKKLLIAMIFVSSVSTTYAQKYLTRTGKISFFSGTSLENIEAFNNEVACVLNAETGAFIIQVPIRSFKFDKALMQEHFNEKYMESDQYPKAEYRGSITDISAINFSKSGTYDVMTKGKMKMHGVINEINVPAKVIIDGDKATIKTTFNVKTKDYKINIPNLVADKIAKEIEVTVNSILTKK